MAAELAGWLLRSTLALTLALAVLMPLRPLVRQLLGPGAVLWLWLLLPAALLATTLPRPASLPVPPARFATEAADATATATALVAPATVAIDAPAIAATDVPERASPAARDHSEAARGAAAAGSPVAGAAAVLRKAFAATPPSPHWLLAAWGLGAFAAAAYLYGQQRRYLRALGPLRRRRDGAWQARAAGLPPAVIGAFAPRIVLPADFDDRFEPAQRRLVLAHERVHLRRGDLQANLGLCVLRCLFWFHPLVHAAAARLRLDQELACDAQVLREHPGGARDYATALLNTQLAVPGLPVGCAWQSSHPLKWRIAMLKKPLHGPARLVPGVVLALAASSATAMSLWQVQPVAAAAPVATVAPAAAPSAAPVAIAAPAAPVAARPVVAPAPVVAVTPAVAAASVSAPAAAPAPVAVAPASPVAAAPTPVAAAAPVAAPAPVAPALPVPAHPAAALPAAPPAESIDAESPVAADAPAAATPAAATPPAAADPALQPARVVHSTLAKPPRYVTRTELEREQEAVVWVMVELDETGRVLETDVVRNELNRDYGRSAMRAVKRWRFEPTRRDGVAVASTIVVPVAFDERRGADTEMGLRVSWYPRPPVPLIAPRADQ